jgi:peptidoglycan hydrolase-like protein with peptidoglycan-binding domain
LSYPNGFGRRLAAAAAVCGVAAFAAVPAEAFSGYRLGSRTLQAGMAGHDVMWLQIDLTKVGFPTRVTSNFNSLTKRSVRSFQQKYGLNADGVFGSGTYHELLLALNHKAIPADQAAPATNAPAASAQKQELPAEDSGGAGFVPPPSDAPVQQATLNSQGLAVAPSGAPEVIQQVIAAANQIAFKPYIYGGGHASFNSSGYDCSGSVSFALHGGGLLASPLDSTEFESYGQPGVGRWITIWANAGHAFMNVAGLWFDTAAQSSSNNNDRWSTTRISPTGQGWTIVHPTGW